MKPIAFLLVAVAALGWRCHLQGSTSGRADEEVVPIFRVKIPSDTPTGN